MRLSSRLSHTNEDGIFYVYRISFFKDHLHWIYTPIYTRKQTYGILYLSDNLTPGFYYVYEKNTLSAWTGFFYWDGRQMHDLLNTLNIPSEVIKKIRSHQDFHKKAIHQIIAEVSSKFYSQIEKNKKLLRHKTTRKFA